MKVVQNFQKELLGGHLSELPKIRGQYDTKSSDVLGLIEEDGDTYVVYRVDPNYMDPEAKVYIERLVGGDLQSPHLRLEYIHDDELWQKLVELAHEEGIITIHKDEKV